MEQITQIYRRKSLLFGLVSLGNFGGLFDVGRRTFFIQICKKNLFVHDATYNYSSISFCLY